MSYIKNKAPFDILLASKKQYSLLTFRSDYNSQNKIDHRIELLKTIDQINSRQDRIAAILEKLNYKKINDSKWKCRLSNPQTKEYNFLYVWTI